MFAVFAREEEEEEETLIHQTKWLRHAEPPKTVEGAGLAGSSEQSDTMPQPSPQPEST